jgi:hypothetical protein
VPTPGLTADQQQVISEASRSEIAKTLGRLKRYFSRDQWLDEDNRYLHKTIRNLDEDFKSNSINDEHLADYIASSVVLHCSDGWSFLARAISSHLAGDANQALHLAYYAELRAAMSLLAGEGVGIFSNVHFAVATTGACLVIPKPKGTHRITWEILEYWATTTSASDLLGKVLWSAGKPLSDWISAFPGGSGAGLVGADFLTTWGVDLCQFSRDRESRNEASYRPSQMSSPSQLNAWHSAKFVLRFWKAFEPSYAKEFQVDKFLLRALLEKTYKSLKGDEGSSEDFMDRIGSALSNLGITDANQREWHRFFSRDSLPRDPSIISMAGASPEIRTEESHIQVIARAALLLRVASGSCRELLGESLISNAELRFWWSGLGENRGLWSTETAPEEFFDLWADIEDALEKLNTWTDDNAPSNCSLFGLLASHARELSRLSSCELIGLWGATP